MTCNFKTCRCFHSTFISACQRIVQRKYPHLLTGPSNTGCLSSGGGGDSRPTSPQVSTGTAGSGGGGPTPRSMYSLPPTPVSAASGGPVPVMSGQVAQPPPPPSTIGVVSSVLCALSISFGLRLP